MSVFGALNRFISRLDADPQAQAQKPGLRSASGFQVLRNTNPEVQIEPWFDFVIGINGRNIDNPDPNLFATELRNCAGNNVDLGVWSAKGQRIRSVWVSVPADATSLGISLQWKPLSATEDVWHILDVTSSSPADNAGLLPYGDYIIGSPESLVKGEAGMGELVEQFLGRPLRLWVYNHEYNVTRLVTMEPSRSWGGSGALGCILGYGALHRIPPALDEPPQAPGETLFETARPSSEITSGYHPSAQPYDLPQHPPLPQDASHFIVPADMDLPPPGPPVGASTVSPPPTTPVARKTGHRTGRARAAPAGMDMDDYFREGEAKSREQDFAPPSKSGTIAPPPPKTGGPPPSRTSSTIPTTESATAVQPADAAAETVMDNEGQIGEGDGAAA